MKKMERKKMRRNYTKYVNGYYSASVHVSTCVCSVIYIFVSEVSRWASNGFHRLVKTEGQSQHVRSDVDAEDMAARTRVQSPRDKYSMK